MDSSGGVNAAPTISWVRFGIPRRRYGLRRARYRGKAKVNLQNQFIGAACNINRWLHMMAWEAGRSTDDSTLKDE